jgi:hypothetical protein
MPRLSSTVLAAFLLTIWSALAVTFFYSHGWLLYYGDAEAHLNIARRIVDSRTPGYDQLGTVWLPLPHVLMLPFVRNDWLWHTGLAGAFPSAVCFVIAGTFLFAAVRLAFDCAPAAWAAMALFATNPNLLYLQSTAMGEPVFFACLMALLYLTVRFARTRGWRAAAGAGLACSLGALTRYEGWFLIPFVAIYIAVLAKKRRVAVIGLFCCLAALGPAYWVAHNWWLTGDGLDFYRGPYSAMAIQRSAAYPGHGNWPAAWLYFRTAVQFCAGPLLVWVGIAGAIAAVAKRVVWPLFLAALPTAFYLWSMHSAASPIFVPGLWPNSYYNARYGLAALPFLAVAAASLATLAPKKAQYAAAAVLVLVVDAYWMIHPSQERWVTWKESQVNSDGRRQWVREAAEFLEPRYRPGSGILTTFGDLTAIYREMGIPLRETFTPDNGVPWLAAVTRPDLFLHQQWAVVKGGDLAQSGVNRAGRYGIRYRLEKTMIVKGEPVIEIYRRIYETSIH